MKNTKIKCAAALVILFILSGSAFLTTDALAAENNSDWNRDTDTLEGALGLHYGKLGGHGVAFRLPIKWFLYLQTAGGIWHTEDRKRHNVGVELHYILRQDARTRIYLAAGLAYFYDKEKTGTQAGNDIWSIENNWNTGLGIGMEFLKGKRWSFQGELDFVRDGENDSITIAPQAGIYYYW